MSLVVLNFCLWASPLAFKEKHFLRCLSTKSYTDFVDKREWVTHSLTHVYPQNLILSTEQPLMQSQCEYERSLELVLLMYNENDGTYKNLFWFQDKLMFEKEGFTICSRWREDSSLKKQRILWIAGTFYSHDSPGWIYTWDWLGYSQHWWNPAVTL